MCEKEYKGNKEGVPDIDGTALLGLSKDLVGELTPSVS